MSDNVFDINIGTEVDQSGADKGLKDVEKKVKDSSKKQTKTIQDANKKNAQAFKDFAKSAAQELLGVDQLLSAMAGGPAAFGKAVVDMGKKAVAALNEMAEKWREQERLEIALQKAAENNPYLNERSVRQLKVFADEMQKLSGIDNSLILESEAKLSRLGRSQEQIQKIIKTATDMAATGMMSYDEAIMELNSSLNGVIRTSGRLFPELRDLSKEALASGEAIDLMAAKVNGAAAEAMQTGAGSVKAFENAVDDLKKAIGSGWEDALRGPRDAMTSILNWYAEGINGIRNTMQYSANIAASKAYVQSVEEEIDAINRRMISSREWQTASDRYSQAVRDNNEALIAQYSAQLNVIEETSIAEMQALRNKIHASQEYMDILLEEHRMLEVLYYMERGESDKYSILEKRRAQEYKRIYEETNRRSLDFAEAARRDAQVLDLLMVSQQAQERARLEAIRDANKAADEDRTRSAEEFRRLNQEALDAEIAKILRKAEIEGRSRDDLQVQKQILDAQVQAYENLLNAAKEFIDGTAPEERERFARLKATWAAYDERAERERVTDEERKRRLAELSKAYEDTQAKLARIFEDIYNERDRLFDLQEEQDHQQKLEEIIKKSLKRSIEFETQYRIEQAQTAQQKILDGFDEEYNRKIEQITRMREIEMEQYAVGSAARLAAEEGLQEEISQLTLEYQRDRETLRVQLESNTAAQIVQIEKDAAEAVASAWKVAWNEAISMAQSYLSAASSIASSISTIWHNSIDYETNERLRANDKMVQSDEERAANEKKILKEAALEKYKADMFMWSANITLATANAGMAVLKTIADYGATPAGIAMAAVATAMGAMQIAKVISAQPQPPRFHSGTAYVQGQNDEVPAVLRRGEAVLPEGGFQNVMRAFANVANSRYGGGGTNLTVNVKNNAANMVSTEQKLSAEGLEVVITQIVKKNLSNGGLDEGLAMQRSHAGGVNITP